MPRSSTALWSQLFELPPNSELPLQARLRAAIVQSILSGRLAEGAAMPSSRELARELGLSRNTVTAACQQLIDEGFLEARQRRGVFVALAASQARPVACEGERSSGPDWSRRVVRTLAGRATLSKPVRWRDYPYPFVYGGHDPALFPLEAFRECCSRSLARAQLPNWSPDLETDDVAELVEQVRQHLCPKRGLFPTAAEIVITVGAQQAFSLLADALIDRGTRLGFEEPGYPHARNAFALRDPRMLPIPVDAEGVCIDALPPLDYLFVTPSHQSPTTATLSLERRRQLLALADERDFIVIEDDYEAENLYEGTPMPALKSLDRNQRVVYVGSLSKSVSPAVRLGYIVASPELIANLRGLRHAMVRHPSAFLQHAYALFLSLGHHESHARRANQATRERVRQTAAALGRWLPDFAFEMPSGGASIWVRMPASVDAAALSIEAREHGVLIESGDVFFAAPPAPCPYFRLRLSSIPVERVDAGVQALAKAVRALRSDGAAVPAIQA